MKKIEINEILCKGCGLCIDVCPKKVLVISEEFNLKGYHPVMITDQEVCTSCAMCAIMCPDVAIKVEK